MPHSDFKRYGQGKTKEDCLKSLSQAIELMLEDRRQDALKSIPSDAHRELVAVCKFLSIREIGHQKGI
jgi:hypothetical protein